MPLTWLRPYLAGGGQAAPGLVWLIGFLGFLNVYSVQAVLPLLTADFAISPVQAGITVGATVLAIGLVSPFIGLMSDAWGRTNILKSALALLTLPTLAIAASRSLDQLVLLRFAQGLLVPGIVVVLIAYLAEEFKGQAVARMMATYVGGTVMGGFSGRFITGHLADVIGWRNAYVGLALLNVLGAVLVWRFLPASRHFVANAHFAAGLRLLWQHLHHQRLMAACGIGFCVLFSLVASFTYINFHLAQPPFSLSTAGLANVFAVYLIGVFITPMAGRLMARLGFRRGFLAALGLSVLGLWVTLLPNLAAVVLGLSMASTGVFLCQSATINAISQNITQGRSLATGLYYMSYYAGGSAGAWGAGLAFEAHGWLGSVLTIGVVQVLAASVVAWVWRERPSAG